MTHRAIIITLCICITGTTVVPASLFPCCCKTQREAIHREAPQPSWPSCNARDVKQCCDQMQVSCCTSDEASSRSSSLIPVCPTCRCHEQMKLVGVSPIAYQEFKLKLDIGFATIPFSDEGRRAVVSHIPKILAEDIRSIIDKSLMTCSFRF